MYNFNKKYLLAALLLQTPLSTTSFASDLPSVFSGEVSSATRDVSTAVPALAGSKRRASVEVASLEQELLSAAYPTRDDLDCSALPGYDCALTDPAFCINYVEPAPAGVAAPSAAPAPRDVPSKGHFVKESTIIGLPEPVENLIGSFLGGRELGKLFQSNKTLKAVYNARVAPLKQYFSGVNFDWYDGTIVPTPQLYENLDKCCVLGLQVSLVLACNSLKNIDQLNQILARGMCLESLECNVMNNQEIYSINNNDDAGIRAILASPHLINLRSLCLNGHASTPVGVRKLFRSRNMPNLERLDLEWNDLGDVGAREISYSSAFPNLKTLNIRCNQIGRNGFRAIGASKHLSKLTTLMMGYNNFGIDSLKAIATMTHLNKLDLKYFAGEGIINIQMARIIVTMENIKYLSFDGINHDAFALIMQHFVLNEEGDFVRRV